MNKDSKLIAEAYQTIGRHPGSTVPKFDYRKGDKVVTPLGHGEIISDVDDHGFCMVKHLDFSDHDGDTFRFSTFDIKHDVPEKKLDKEATALGNKMANINPAGDGHTDANSTELYLS